MNEECEDAHMLCHSMLVSCEFYLSVMNLLLL